MNWLESLAFLMNMSTVSLILFIAGLVLLGIEMFTPGFGAFGALGFACLTLGIIFTARSVREALILSLILMLIAGIMLAVVLRSASRGGLSKKLILTEHEADCSVKSYEMLIGKSGTAETVLRPSGIAVIDSRRIDVMTQGEYLMPGTPVIVVDAKGSSVIVRKNIKEE